MTRSQSLTGDIELDLGEFDDAPAQPLPLLRAWFEAAEQHEVREPRVGSLATIGQGGPTTRTLLVKAVGDHGLTFTTSQTSRKGRELLVDSRCSLNFYWRETMQQIVVNGSAYPVSDAASDAEFAARPESARAIAIASAQSAPLADEGALRSRVNTQLHEGSLARPIDWSAWLLVPNEIEFWHGSADRFHRRLVYRRADGGDWTHERLQP